MNAEPSKNGEAQGASGVSEYIGDLLEQLQGQAGSAGSSDTVINDLRELLEEMAKDGYGIEVVKAALEARATSQKDRIAAG